MNNLETLLLQSNEVLRSAYQIAERKGVATNWQSFSNKVLFVLAKQHEVTNELRKRAAEENIEAGQPDNQQPQPESVAPLCDNSLCPNWTYSGCKRKRCQWDKRNTIRRVR